MAGLNFSIELHGFKETLAKLKSDVLFGPPWREAMGEVADLAGDAVRAGAPIGTPTRNYRPGQTVLRVSTRVQQNVPIPNYVVVKTSARRRGYPYPRLQEYSPFAQSRYRKGRNRNRGWFARAVRRVDAGMENILRRAADHVERIWRQ